MKTQSILRSICTTRILPIVTAVTLASLSGSAFASVQGQAAISAEIANIPTVKAGTTLEKLKPNDLLFALCLALENPANAGLTADNLAVSSLETRKDGDKLAGQVVATTIATVGAQADSAVATAVTVGVFGMPTLKSAGQAQAFAAGLSSITDSSIGNPIGVGIAGEFGGSQSELQNLLLATTKVTGKSTESISSALQSAIDGLFDANEVPVGDRATFIASTAQKVSSSNPAAAGAFFGGLVLNNPNGAYDSDSELTSLAQGVVADKKLIKSIGEIIGDTQGAHTLKAGLAATLIAGQNSNTQALIIQGVVKAGNATETAAIIGTALPAFTAKSSDRIKASGVVAFGNGNDQGKLNAIVSAFANAQTATDKSKIGIEIINAVGTDNPESAKGAMGALVDSAGGVGDPVTFAGSVVSKIKSTSAAGYAAAEIADRSGTVNGAVSVAANLIEKAKKAATDISQQVSALSFISDKTAFAGQLADSSPSYVQNIAVGASIASPSDADSITATVVTHDVNDKKAISKVANIAGAVAIAVDPEEGAEIATSLGGLTSDNGSAPGKPIKAQSLIALASSLAKAIQAKAGVSTVNRMDELGEIAAVLTATVIEIYGGNSKTLTKTITKLGTTIAGVLSKNPVNETKELVADTSEARDIAGSMAQTVAESSLSQSDKDALIGTTDVTKGAIGVGVLKKSGKKGSADYNSTVTALQEVRDDSVSTQNKFENGSVNDPETDTKNG